MKSIFVMFLAAVFSINMSAQTGKLKNESIKVWGNCGMCKERIEKAAKAEGAATASWDSKTKLLAVSYDPSKTNADALAKKMAAVGHDTEKFKADEKVYNALPGCCHYDREKAPAASDKVPNKK